MSRVRALAIAAASLCLSGAGAFAAQTNANLNLTITLAATCKIQSVGTLNFGTNGVLDAAKTANTTMGIQCTSATPYTISFSGTSAVSSVTGRMTKGTEFVNYAATLSAAGGTGNGAIQNYTVNGSVPAQTTPSPGTYTGTQTIYVTY